MLTPYSDFPFQGGGAPLIILVAVLNMMNRKRITIAIILLANATAVINIVNSSLEFLGHIPTSDDIINSANSSMNHDYDDNGSSRKSTQHHSSETLHRVSLELRRISNNMLNSNGMWNKSSTNNKGWIWISSPAAFNGRDQTNFLNTSSPAHHQQHHWSSSLVIAQGQHDTMQEDNDNSSTQPFTATSFPKSTTVAMYGSSYTREIFLEMERLHYNISTYNTCNNLSWSRGYKVCHTSHQWAEVINQDPILYNSNCMPISNQLSLGSRSECSSHHHPCNDFTYPAPYGEGINLDICGPPGFRSDKNLSTVVGFKTFIHTPALENLFLERISNVGMRNVDVAIVEMGYPWGARGDRAFNMSLPINMTLQDEISYYVHWVHEIAFPETIIIWVATCGCTKGGSNDMVGVEETLDLVREKELGVVLDKRYLCDKKPRDIHAGHGCAEGPVMNVLGRMIFRLLDYIDQNNVSQHR